MEKQSIYLPRVAEILKVKKMTKFENFYQLKFVDGSAMNHLPGQFVEWSMPGYGESPFGLASSATRGNTFDLVVRSVGNVTGAIHKLQEGDKVGIRGPLGKGFPLEKLYGKDIVIVAGGIGLVPTRSLIQYVFDNRSKFANFKILFGCKTPSERLFTDELEEWKNSKEVEFLETVDQAEKGWTGNVGLITTLFSKFTLNSANTRMIICGPPVMYKFVVLEAKKQNVPDENIYMDLERRMKCGVGKCGHCQINNMYVCTDGPVYNYADIRNVKEAL